MRFLTAPPRDRLSAALGLLVVVVSLVACGGSPPAAAKPARIEVTASEMKFEPKSVSVRAGEVTFVVKNVGTVEHSFIIDDSAGATVGSIPSIALGATQQLAVTLKPGTYTLICNLPGHKEAGMTGMLTVT